MNTTPLISVIMSVYNAERYLHQAIDSILQQTFPDFEFIIIEDGSTDRSAEILEMYAKQDQRLKLIRKSKNKGAKGFIENLNLGLDQAKGKYIARMDADDISDPDRFQQQMDFLEKHPSVFIVGASMNGIDENGDFIKFLQVHTDDHSIKKNMLRNIALFHPVIMFRNSDIRYRDKMISCEDYDLYLRMMLENKKMANLSTPLLKYRILQNSLSRKDKTFIRWMMVEKARFFYAEKRKTGSDSYHDFNPDDIQNILTPEYKNRIEDLVFAAKTAIKFEQKEELSAILDKIRQHYPEKNTTKYQIALQLSGIVLKLYSKILF